MSQTEKRQARRDRCEAKHAARSFADGIEPRLLRKPVHLTSGERKFLGRTWNDADAARTNMPTEKQHALTAFDAVIANRTLASAMRG